jgi:predicted nucleic acid-binding protein
MLAENTNPFPCIAVDTSFMAAYILNGYCSDELSDCIKEVEYILNNNGQFYVPQLFWYEIENVLLYKIRKNKKGQVYLSKSDVMDIIYDLQQLPIYTDLQPDGEIRQRIFDMAEEHNLSYYDASYLELARRYSIPLKTYDADSSAAFESYKLS